MSIDKRPAIAGTTNSSNTTIWDDDMWKQVSLYLFNKHPILHHRSDGGVESTPEVHCERKTLIWSLCGDIKDAGVRITPADFMERLGINRTTYTFGMGHRKYFLRDLPEDNLIALQDREEDAA